MIIWNNEITILKEIYYIICSNFGSKIFIYLTVETHYRCRANPLSARWEKMKVNLWVQIRNGILPQHDKLYEFWCEDKD